VERAAAGQAASDQPIPLDHNGAPTPTTPTPPSPPAAPGTFWQSKTAISRHVQTSLHFHGPTGPRLGVCELTQHGLPGLAPEWGRTITSIPVATNAVGELFISCVDTECYLIGTPLNAGILLDARHPGHTLDSLPGAQPVSGNRDPVNDNAADLSAKRIGTPGSPRKAAPRLGTTTSATSTPHQQTRRPSGDAHSNANVAVIVGE
jgi:hypothetical protein